MAAEGPRIAPGTNQRPTIRAPDLDPGSVRQKITPINRRFLEFHDNYLETTTGDWNYRLHQRPGAGQIPAGAGTEQPGRIRGCATALDRFRGVAGQTPAGARIDRPVRIDSCVTALERFRSRGCWVNPRRSANTPAGRFEQEGVTPCHTRSNPFRYTA